VSSSRDTGRSLESGKLPSELLASLLAAFPPTPPDVRLGARIGEDASAVDVPSGTLVVAADPITLTSSEVARLSVLINANDVAVCGARPRWFLAVVLVPPATSERAVRELFGVLQRTLDELGAVLVGGHTEVTPVVSQPVIVGVMMGIVEQGAIVETAGCTPGDVLLQVRPAPIEGAAVLAREAASRLGELDADVLAQASAAIHDPGISLVDAALLATELEAKALHDPTEGGLLMGLHEMAEAGEVAIRIDTEAVLWFEPGLAVCEALGCDPWSTLASGTLLAAFPASRADEAISAFEAARYEVATLGAVEAGEGVIDRDGQAMPRREQDEVARIRGE
jgi:hydrogenase expression/formation protein HypE